MSEYLSSWELGLECSLPNSALKKILNLFIVHVHVCTYMCNIAHMWRSESNLWLLVYSFHHLCSSDPIQVIRPSGKHLYLLTAGASHQAPAFLLKEKARECLYNELFKGKIQQIACLLKIFCKCIRILCAICCIGLLPVLCDKHHEQEQVGEDSVYLA